MTYNPLLSPNPGAAGAGPLRAALGDYLLMRESEGIARATLNSSRYACARLVEYAGPLEPAALTPQLLRAWLAAMAAEGLSVTSRRDYLRAARTWIGWLAAEECYGVSPQQQVRGNLDRIRALLGGDRVRQLHAEDAEGELHTLLGLAYLHARTGETERARALYREVAERSMAVPDASCRLFAQFASECLAAGKVPPPGLVLLQLYAEEVGSGELSEAKLSGVVGGRLTYIGNHISDGLLGLFAS